MADKEQKAAVYMAWATFKNEVMDGLSRLMPGVIDKSVFSGQAGGVQSQIMAGMKFLNLIDEKGKPTEALEELTTKDEATRKVVLARILRERYAAIFTIGIEKATGKQLADTMAAAYSMNGDTLDKAIRFFLSAAKYAEIPISVYLEKGNARRRPSGPRKPRTEATAEETPTSPPPPTGSDSRTVTLSNGDAITITMSVGLSRLKGADRQFVFGLIDMLDEFESGVADDGDESDEETA
jgi:Family of unknown function (DUF5343)